MLVILFKDHSVISSVFMCIGIQYFVHPYKFSVTATDPRNI